jgi:hypothetical protein
MLLTCIAFGYEMVRQYYINQIDKNWETIERLSKEVRI